CSNGIGSDAFALVWDEGELHGLNGSGRAPGASSASALRGAGMREMPTSGWGSVTVPGAVRAWADLHERFGRLPFTEVIEPAVRLAEEGFALSPVVADAWDRGVQNMAGAPEDPALAGFLPHFAPSGALGVGGLWRSDDTAATLRAIARSHGTDFYSGDLAERIVAFSESTGGHLTIDDLDSHRSEWVNPIAARYRDHEVWEIPPNGQGIAALIALRILDGFDPDDVAPFGRAGGPADLSATPNPAAWHRAVEAMKLALADTHALVADPAIVDVPVEELLADAHIDARRARIGERALSPTPVDPRSSDTVYLATADGDGQMVSFIQSNFWGFGSGIVVPGTGISLQSRASGFSLEPGHPNELAPGKRPFHTIIPGFLSRGGQPVGPFGVMGGHMQAQGHVQVVLDTVDLRDDPQTALGRPRWFWNADTGSVDVEATAGDAILTELGDRGHTTRVVAHAGALGRGQAIWRTNNGTLAAASEPRADGYPVGW
ncbi:MAG: gamma-glutamyltransferase, partial [Propionibacterium sp.]|nr:gamma-glutamyltransferase [Propionibacterium sp.]